MLIILHLHTLFFVNYIDYNLCSVDTAVQVVYTQTPEVLLVRGLSLTAVAVHLLLSVAVSTK